MAKYQKPSHICTQCHYSGLAALRGSGGIEFILWCFYLLPGLIYSVWRRGRNSNIICLECGGKTMIPIKSPRGRDLLQATHFSQSARYTADATNNINSPPIPSIEIAEENSKVIIFAQYIASFLFFFTGLGALSLGMWPLVLTMTISGLLILPSIREKFFVNTFLESGRATFLIIVVLFMLAVIFTTGFN